MYKNPYHNKNIDQFSFLVTGGAGFIGSNIVEYLLKYGAKKVRVLDNFSTGLRENIKGFLTNPAFELVEADIRSLTDCKKAVEGIDFVSHQAALGSVPRSINDPITSDEVNVTGFLNMLVAAKDASVKRMVFAASSSTYGDHPDLPKVESKIGNPLSPYAVTKYVNELYANVFSRIYNFHTIGLRYFNVFGPRQNPQGPYAAVIPLFIQSALNNEAACIYGDGNTSRDFTFVENAVSANIKAMLIDDDEMKYEVFNIACGSNFTLNQLWQYISELACLNIPAVFREERKGDVRHSIADITKAQTNLGYNAEIAFKEGLQITFDWFKNSSIQ